MANIPFVNYNELNDFYTLSQLCIFFSLTLFKYELSPW